jgi:dUTP pyrophosphatase
MILGVKYKIINPNAKVPQRSTPESAYYDICSCESVQIDDGSTVAVHTGLKIRPPPGYFIDIRPRSGLGLKGISISNSPGTLDYDYNGELMVILYNHSGHPYNVEIGHKIAQINLMPTQELRFHETEIKGGNHAGFGSTGL